MTTQALVPMPLEGQQDTGLVEAAQKVVAYITDLKSKEADIVDRSIVLLADARALTIDDDVSYTVAGSYLKQSKAGANAIEALYEPIKKVAYSLHRGICKLEGDALDNFVKVDELLVKPYLVYDEAKTLKAKAEEERLRKIEFKRAEDEQLEEAIRLEAAGDTKGALAVLAQETVAPPVLVDASTPQVEGVSKRPKWKWRKTDDFDIKKVPYEYLQLDETAIDGVVKALKKATNIPGIEAYDAKGLTRRA